jgi:hypothetical protein
MSLHPKPLPWATKRTNASSWRFPSQSTSIHTIVAILQPNERALYSPCLQSHSHNPWQGCTRLYTRSIPAWSGTFTLYYNPHTHLARLNAYSKPLKTRRESFRLRSRFSPFPSNSALPAEKLPLDHVATHLPISSLRINSPHSRATDVHTLVTSSRSKNRCIWLFRVPSPAPERSPFRLPALSPTSVFLRVYRGILRVSPDLVPPALIPFSPFPARQFFGQSKRAHSHDQGPTTLARKRNRRPRAVYPSWTYIANRPQSIVNSASWMARQS